MVALFFPAGVICLIPSLRTFSVRPAYRSTRFDPSSLNSGTIQSGSYGSNQTLILGYYPLSTGLLSRYLVAKKTAESKFLFTAQQSRCLVSTIQRPTSFVKCFFHIPVIPPNRCPSGILNNQLRSSFHLIPYRPTIRIFDCLFHTLTLTHLSAVSNFIFKITFNGVPIVVWPKEHRILYFSQTPDISRVVRYCMRVSGNRSHSLPVSV